MKKNLTELVCLLDRSGSMQGLCSVFPRWVRLFSLILSPILASLDSTFRIAFHCKIPVQRALTS